MEYFFAAVLVGIILFAFLHLRPLADHEVTALARKRRRHSIGHYFQTDNAEQSVNMEFKKFLNPRGMLYNVDYPLRTAPSTIAALLKYKKHEWMAVAFEKEKRVRLLWVNKGLDNSSAAISMPVDRMLEETAGNGYSSILVFHNHPNSDPHRYDCTQPSNADRESAARWARILNLSGVTLLEYVCERGRYFRYFLSASDAFLPLADFVDSVTRANGRSACLNLLLHLERILL